MEIAKLTDPQIEVLGPNSTVVVPKHEIEFFESHFNLVFKNTHHDVQIFKFGAIGKMIEGMRKDGSQVVDVLLNPVRHQILDIFLEANRTGDDVCVRPVRNESSNSD